MGSQVQDCSAPVRERVSSSVVGSGPVDWRAIGKEAAVS